MVELILLLVQPLALLLFAKSVATVSRGELALPLPLPPALVFMFVFVLAPAFLFLSVLVFLVVMSANRGIARILRRRTLRSI